MLALTFFVIVSALFTCASALPSPLVGAEPTILARAPGPSGAVLTPSDGTFVLNLGGSGDLYIQYQRVNETLPNAEGPAYTVGIDVYLYDPSGYQANQTIVNGFRGYPITARTIEGNFIPPPEACSTYKLIVIEHQFIHNTVITFEAASPSITIECGPIQ